MKNFPFPTVPIIAKFPHITVPIIAEFPPSNCSQSLLNFCAVCRGMPWPGKKLILQQMMDVHSLCKLYPHQNIQLPKSKQQQQGLWTVSKLCTVYEQQHAPSVSGCFAQCAKSLRPFCTLCTWGQMGGWSCCGSFCPHGGCLGIKLFMYAIL